MMKFDKRRFAAACAVAAFALAAEAGMRAVTPVAASEDPNNWWTKRHQERLQLAAKGGAPVVFIGDSITHGWEGAGRAQWQRYFAQGPRRALNLGFSADRTEHVLWRLENGELDGYEARIVFLMIGTNNAGHFLFAAEPPADTICGIRAILRKIREKQPKAKVVLTAIFPRENNDRGDTVARRNAIVNREIARYADGVNVFWLDFNEQLRLDSGALSPEIFPDMLHPSGYGYEVWASAVIPYVDAALSDGRLPMPPNRYAPFLRAEAYPRGPLATLPVTRINEGHDERGGDWWTDRLLQKRSQIADAKGTFDLVMIGDSITHFWERDWAKASRDALTAKYATLNLGYGGDRTEHLLWRLENGELEGYKARCITLMIGTNNREGLNDRSSAHDIALGIRRNLDVILAKHPEAKVLLMPIFPRGADANDALRRRNDRVNAEIRSFADGDRVRWLDFTAKFLDEKGDTKPFMNDRLHPNAAGYKIWLDAMLPAVREICGK